MKFLTKKIKSYECLNIKDIYEYANTCNLDNVKKSLKRQLEYNYQIALAGINGDYGASIGYILNKNAKDLKEKAKAYTAAASDARMAGASLPVVIISGSGNQGITASVPLVIYAKEYQISEEKLLRSLILSDLIILEEKKDIGRLSAFCGAISAGVGAVAGICYMLGGTLEAISHTVVNALAISSGIICDGAKSSCAAKIALALESGFIGYNMYLEN
ncbi:protein containing Serine dehydratase alpha chain domain protein, partial [gut metagenome]